MIGGEDTCPRDRDGFCGVALLALKHECFTDAGCALKLSRDEKMDLIERDWDKRFSKVKKTIQSKERDLG